jgi:hypothetical protein
MCNFFGFCIIYILYTGCAKIKKKNSGAKRLRGPHCRDHENYNLICETVSTSKNVLNFEIYCRVNLGIALYLFYFSFILFFFL